VKTLERISQLLAQCASNETHLRPTELYNEGWMLRLILDWCSEHQSAIEPLVFYPGARWYAEALLPSRFGGRRGLSEGFTHADAVIGQFYFRPGKVGHILVSPEASQLCVVEAKMSSLLSPGVSNARAFNQAARSVACMAHMTSIGKKPANNLTRLSFIVIAPEQRVREGAFDALMTSDSIVESVKARVEMFSGEHDEWFTEHFQAFLSTCVIQLVSWEGVIAAIARVDQLAGEELEDFFRLCLKFNPLVPRRQERG
jgi:hypothetical protein